MGQDYLGGGGAVAETGDSVVFDPLLGKQRTIW